MGNLLIFTDCSNALTLSTRGKKQTAVFAGMNTFSPALTLFVTNFYVERHTVVLYHRWTWRSAGISTALLIVQCRKENPRDRQFSASRCGWGWSDSARPLNGKARWHSRTRMAAASTSSRSRPVPCKVCLPPARVGRHWHCYEPRQDRGLATERARPDGRIACPPGECRYPHRGRREIWRWWASQQPSHEYEVERMEVGRLRFCIGSSASSSPCAVDL